MERKTKEKKVKEYFRGTEVGFMIEVFQSDLKVVAEGLGGKIEDLGKRVGSLEQRFDGLEQGFDKFEKGTKDNFEVIKEYLFRIDDRLNEIKKDLKEG